MKEVQLKCSVSKGMFPGEAGVSFKAVNGADISLFCTSKYVNNKDQMLVVKFLKQEGDVVSIRLPAESLSGSRIEEVKADQIKEMQPA